MRIQTASLALLGVVLTPVGGNAQSVSVTVANGTLVGVEDSATGIQRFLGIPYAQPPIGDLRLRQAKPLATSFGTWPADAFGSSCYGSRAQPNASEDCLTLNIWRLTGKQAQENGSLPVLVWLYGGGLTAGYTSNPLFEGTNMVRISTEIQKPVILVSVNYRLGPLGFLNGKQMANLGLLNIGMLDQRLALHWIHENIAAFGGDPSKVTLFGESAGAVSIYSHMMAYGGRDDGLFRGAIMESGGAFPLELPNATSFQQTFDSLLTNTSCSTTLAQDATAAQQLDCIRALPINVFRASVGSKTGQSIDGDFTRTSIQFALPAGGYLKVATIVGTNTDEGTNSAPKGINTTKQLFDPLAQGYFRPQRLPNATVSKLLELYPTDPRQGCPYNTGTTKLTSGALDKQACSIFGDLVMVAPARQFASTLAADGVPVYRYRFNQLPPGGSPARGISTGVEEAYVFSNFVRSSSPGSASPSAWDQALAYEMTSAWVSFAHDLDPNPGGNSALPHWPVYGEEANSIVFNGYGSWIEKDTYRDEGIQYIIENVLPHGAL
ncbi:Alpha/Beta hydrolase protein [Apiospora rasikravindrae]|uniref:Carboxylic ester hydrolase n=1 Tax=Apiospora rasikravindrae TaxID=990691 RepID=A0ABR1RTA2_9PEZI